MTHARSSALNQLTDLLDALRSLPGLIETTRGVFYRGSAAFLRVHESATGALADLRTPAGWTRFELRDTNAQRTVFSMARTLVRSAVHAAPQSPRLC